MATRGQLMPGGLERKATNEFKGRGELCPEAKAGNWHHCPAKASPVP